MNNIFNCPFCQQDTAGNHEWGCPNNRDRNTYYTDDRIDDETFRQHKIKKIDKEIERLKRRRQHIEAGGSIEPIIMY